VLKRKVISIIGMIIAIVLVVGLFAGCGSTASDSSDVSTATVTSTAAATSTAATTPIEAPKKDVTISFTATGDKTWIYAIDETIIEDFTKETGIKIDVQRTPADQYASVLKTKFASGEGPDMSMIWPEANASQFLPEKNFLDLSGEPWVAGLTESAKRNQSYGGKVIGWGSSGGDYGWGMLYSKDIFTKLQLTIPKTFADFTAVCEKIKTSGITPFYGTLKDSWSAGVWMSIIGPLAESKDPGLYEKLNKNEAKFADVKEFETMINDFKSAYDKGYLGKSPFGIVNDGLVAVSQGKAAMTLVNDVPEGWYKSLNVEIDLSKFGLFPAPFADNNMLSAYDGGLIRAINKNGANIDACKEYLNYISKPDVLTKYYADPEIGVTPSFTTFADKFTWPDITKELVANSDGKTFSVMETGIKFWDNTNFGNYIISAIIGKTTAKDALQSIDKDREKIFSAQQN
jgi:raffinose/stachyose/melibiose transport system substrate-binding protein